MLGAEEDHTACTTDVVGRGRIIKSVFYNLKDAIVWNGGLLR